MSSPRLSCSSRRLFDKLRRSRALRGLFVYRAGRPAFLFRLGFMPGDDALEILADRRC